MNKSREIVLIDSDDIEEFFLEMSGMRTHYLPLSRRSSSIAYRIDELDGVTLSWCKGGGAARWVDETTAASLHVGFTVEPGGEIRFCGRPVRDAQIQIWVPGEETELVIKPPYSTLEIGVAEKIVSALGWHVDGQPLREVPPQRLRRLVRMCRRASMAARESAHPIALWRDQVLDELEQLLNPLFAQAAGDTSRDVGTRNFRLVREADRFMNRLQHGGMTDIDELATSIGIPRRTLFYAFRRHLGIAPMHYFRIKRLRALRSALRTARSDEATVTGLAVEHGFGDMGRLAHQYHEHFGEYPSETLRS